jgi:hypothetical protein
MKSRASMQSIRVVAAVTTVLAVGIAVGVPMAALAFAMLLTVLTISAAVRLDGKLGRAITGRDREPLRAAAPAPARSRRR